MKRRKLAPEELELWQRVAAKTERMSAPAKFNPDTQLPSPPPPAVKRAKSVVLGKPVSNRPGPKHNLAPSLPEQISRQQVQMDRKAYGKLKRGKLVPEGRLDLHGMTLDRAHPALTGFIIDAHKRGKRLVLVITGKGKDRDEGGPIPTRLGVLRHQVPQWLGMAPLKPLVLQVAQAHIAHGGGGAYYIYLRRSR
ncbi:MAG: Smr/MutS family protein [Sulfitobacter sp.]